MLQDAARVICDDRALVARGKAPSRSPDASYIKSLVEHEFTRYDLNPTRPA